MQIYVQCSLTMVPPCFGFSLKSLPVAHTNFHSVVRFPYTLQGSLCHGDDDVLGFSRQMYPE